MKKYFQIWGLIICLFSFVDVFSQSESSEDLEECRLRLSEFIEYAKLEDYNYAYDAWWWCFNNCQQASKTIYKYGLKIAENRYEKAEESQKSTRGELIDKIYTQRIQYFPDNLGKVYSDWAISLEKRKAPKAEVYEKLELAFQTDPAQMSIKNIFRYFQDITDKNRDSDIQKVFDTYDDAIDAVNSKIDFHSKALDSLNDLADKGIELSNNQKIQQKNHKINLRGLGQIENGLDNIISEIATCDKLVPLYSKNLDSRKNDPKWLRRAASRLNTKDCTSDAIFPKLVEAFVTAEPSADAYIYYAKVLEDRGKSKEAMVYRNKAVDLETDPYKKAKYLYKIGSTYIRKSPSKAASYAKKALMQQPSMGRAYLLIASAYSASANSCGSDEFSKRMVYVAAADKAIKAKAIDPSISTLANKYIKSYNANRPSRTDIFTKGLKSGDPWKVECWINETVIIP